MAGARPVAEGRVGLRRIVVTGGSGRLGGYILDRLADRTVTVADIRPPNRDIDYRKADIEDHAAMARTFAGAEAVIHLAAIPNPRTAPAEVTFRVNVQGTWSVLQAAEDAGVKRVVVASSDAILGLSYNPPDWKPQYLPIDEDHPIRPTEFYSLSKEATESICRSYAH
ncbi:MAG: NAD-dependent epimerase/dehydratase family protein, partial [Alphaproteobacteria bacterium]